MRSGASGTLFALLTDERRPPVVVTVVPVTGKALANSEARRRRPFRVRLQYRADPAQRRDPCRHPCRQGVAVVVNEAVELGDQKLGLRVGQVQVHYGSTLWWRRWFR